MSERTTLVAPAAAREAVAARAAVLPGKITVEIPPAPRAFDRRGRLSILGKALKVTIVIDPQQLRGVEVPPGIRPELVISVAGRAVTGSFNAKSLRRAIAAVAEHGAEGVAIVVQGKLVGDQLEEAGIVATPKKPKEAAA